MELARLNGRFLRVATLAAVSCCAIIVLYALWQAAQWQNSIRELMELGPVDTAHPLKVSLIALAIFAIMIVLARIFRLTLGFVAARVSRFLPRQVSNVISVIAAAAPMEFSSERSCPWQRPPSGNTTR
jgi:uncharacterized membrane protein